MVEKDELASEDEQVPGMLALGGADDEGEVGRDRFLVALQQHDEIYEVRVGAGSLHVCVVDASHVL